MDKELFYQIIHRFNLVNDYTDNPNIWVGHGRIGNLGCPRIEEAKQILEKHLGDEIAEDETTPEWIRKTLSQWENAHPFQHIHEKGQPLFAKKFESGKIIVAAIWPWQIKKNIASLMLYEGSFIE